MLLLDDLLLLLQRQDERLLLKSHSRTLTPTPDGKTMLRPVLRLTSAMTREVATGEAWPWARGLGAQGVGREPSKERGIPRSGEGEAAAEVEQWEAWQARGRLWEGGRELGRTLPRCGFYQ